MIEYAVLGGFVLDCLFGDPAWLPHPVVYMGKAISALTLLFWLWLLWQQRRKSGSASPE